MKKLKNKVAIITGGSMGMGAAHARLFIEQGAQVVLTDVEVEKGQKLADELGENALFIEHDVTDEEGWKAVVEQTEDTYGPVNILVNNAGVSTILSVNSSLEEYMQIVMTNQVSVFLGMKYVVPSMKKSEAGSIINISSINGITGGALGYTDTKFAVRGMTRAAANELAPHNIRVNSVHPGVIDTPMVQNNPALKQIEAMAQGLPLKRMGLAHEVSQLVLFLASDDSSYSTGSEFVADGGMLA